MRMVSLIACAAAALFIVMPAAAQTAPAPSGGATSADPGPAAASPTAKKGLHVKQGQTRKQTFDKLDTNHDGSISRSEAEASPDLMIIFLDMDTSGDGQLSPAEFVIVPITQEDGSTVQ